MHLPGHLKRCYEVEAFGQQCCLNRACERLVYCRHRIGRLLRTQKALQCVWSMLYLARDDEGQEHGCSGYREGALGMREPTVLPACALALSDFGGQTISPRIHRVICVFFAFLLSSFTFSDSVVRQKCQTSLQVREVCFSPVRSSCSCRAAGLAV